MRGNKERTIKSYHYEDTLKDSVFRIHQNINHKQ